MFGSFTGDFHPICNAPMLGAHHALQRPAPRVTLAAAGRPAAYAHPAPAAFPQPARRAPQFAELGVVRRMTKTRLLKTTGVFP